MAFMVAPRTRAQSAAFDTVSIVNADINVDGVDFRHS
jgi:hypothetical protein